MNIMFLSRELFLNYQDKEIAPRFDPFSIPKQGVGQFAYIPSCAPRATLASERACKLCRQKMQAKYEHKKAPLNCEALKSGLLGRGLILFDRQPIAIINPLFRYNWRMCTEQPESKLYMQQQNQQRTGQVEILVPAGRSIHVIRKPNIPTINLNHHSLD